MADVQDPHRFARNLLGAPVDGQLIAALPPQHSPVSGCQTCGGRARSYARGPLGVTPAI
jgi:hypothetical protein